MRLSRMISSVTSSSSAAINKISSTFYSLTPPHQPNINSISITRRNSISLNKSSSFPLYHSISVNKQYLSALSRELNRFSEECWQAWRAVYLSRNPTAKAILELVGSASDEQIYYDHFAFRTFGVNGYGIDSMAKFFLDFGYTPREE